MRTIIVIPTYNEKENIENLINDIFSLKIPDLKIIVVDDNSPDGTAMTIFNAQQIYPQLYLIKRPKKQGLGSAYVAGFKKALALGAELIIEMDADYSHNPQDIPRLTKECENGFQLVIGSRKIPGGRIVGWNWWRKLTSAGAMFFSRLILGIKTKDVTAGFRCYRREALEKINLENIKSNGYAFQEELLYLTQKNQCKIKEIPVIFNDRRLGFSKLSTKDIIEFFLVIIKLRLKK
jgi:dolichol-phosphate mannosyltransferase